MKPLGGGVGGYLDIVPKEGYNHLALFSPPDSGTPIWLTEGKWEATSIEGIDHEKGIVWVARERAL